MSPKRETIPQFGTNDVLHLTSLAYLEIPSKEISTMARQLGDVVEYFRILRDVDTKSVDPASIGLGLKNRFRPDEARPFSADEILKVVPKRKGRYVKAPKAL